jgi:nitrite reductase/ring-hydroxylating ferredoxin subunit
MMKKGNDKISRQAFLKKIGFSGTSLLAVYCLGWGISSCTTEKLVGSADDFTLDISKGKFRVLQQAGGWIKVNNVVIACTSPGQFVAISSICSHEGENRVEYRPAEKDFRCSAHGAEFNLNGTGKNKKARKGIPVFETSLNEQLLRIRLPKA